MFWNLVRYEFKNVNKWYLALYAAVLVLSVPLGMQGTTILMYLSKIANLSYLSFWLSSLVA